MSSSFASASVSPNNSLTNPNNQRPSKRQRTKSSSPVDVLQAPPVRLPMPVPHIVLPPHGAHGVASNGTAANETALSIAPPSYSRLS